MMKKILIFLVFLAPFVLSAQVLEPYVTANKVQLDSTATDSLYGYLWADGNTLYFYGTSGWTAIGSGGGGTPGGADTQVQFNDGGSFGGDSDFVWDKASNLLTVTGDVYPSNLYVNSGNYISLTNDWAVDVVGFTASAGYLRLHANSLTPRMVINTSGQVGINDASPSYLVDINGTGRVVNDWYVGDSLGVNTTSPLYDFHLVGDGYASDDFTVGDSLFVDVISANTVGSGSYDGNFGTLQGDTLYTPIDTSATVLNGLIVSDGADLQTYWLPWDSLYSDPMTTRGDIIYRNASNVTARLPVGANTYVLTSDGTDVSWAAPSGGSGDSSYFDLSSTTITTKSALDSVSFGGDAFSIEGNRFYTDPHNSTCIFIGEEAGNTESTHGDGNIGIGYQALESVQSGGYYNMAFGYRALDEVTYADYNYAFGYRAGGLLTSGGNNIVIGRSAGVNLVGGSYNTIVGSYAMGGNGAGSLTRSIFFGYYAGRYETADNTLIIDNIDRSTEANAREEALIYGVTNSDSSQQVLHLGGMGTVYLEGAVVHEPGTIADNDATPSVTGAEIWTYAGASNSVTITDLDNPVAGATYTIIGNSDTYTVTINDSGNFNLSANWTGGIDDVLILYCQADNDYIELGRVDN